MNRLFIAFSAFVAAAACTAGAQTGSAPLPPPAETMLASPPLAGAPDLLVECEILTTRTPNGVRFSAVAHSDVPATGEYEFVLTKIDRNGTSDISQGGAFDLTSESSQSLGEAELNIERRSSYRARLVLWDDDGEVCRVERQS